MNESWRFSICISKIIAMASYLLALPLLLASISLLLTPVACDEKQCLLKGINSFRQSQNLSTLTSNDKASCFAKQIAKQLEGQPCSHVTDPNTVPGVPEILRKCKVKINYTTDGLMLSVCVAKRVPNLVLNNFTKTFYTSYLKNSNFTGAGIGTEDDWTVIVLSTSTLAGSFSSFACRVSWSFYCLISVMVLFLF
ncbi:hypothetical protein ACET3Z_003093 [Daucus carota]